MTALSLFIGWVLIGQASAADGRYQAPASGQPPANGQAAQTTSAGSTADTSAPFTGGGYKTGGDGQLGIAPIGGDAASGRNASTDNSMPPNTLPLIEGDTRPISTANPANSTPRAYGVTPAQSLGAAPAASASLTPSQMMRAMLAPQAGSQLRGTSISLVEVMGGARTRAEQTQRAEAYWDLCSSVADYYLGLREQDELRRYVQRGGQWDQFELEMRNRTGTAQRAAVASQLRLASLMGRGSGYLPLPSDVPHCASYHTQYQQIFPNGGPQEAKELNDLLPLRYNELKVAAALVGDSEQYLNTFASSRSNDVDGGLKALHLLGLQRRAFVQIARDYNRRIARYAELASPAPLTAERLTGMLIKMPVSTATRPASSAPSLNRQTNRTAPPPTYAEGAAPPKRDDSVRPVSGSDAGDERPRLPRREHSLLVTPQE